MLLRLGGSFELKSLKPVWATQTLPEGGEEGAFESLRQVNSKPVWATKELRETPPPTVFFLVVMG